MVDRISCPHCHRVLEAAPNYGAEVRCPECAHVFVSGPPTGITAQTPSAPTEIPSTRAPRARGTRLTHSDVGDDDLRDIAVSGPAFKAGGGLALTLKILLGLDLLLGAVLLCGEYLQYQLALRLVTRAPVAQPEIIANDERQMVLGLLVAAGYVVTAVVFLVWFHRIHANLKPLGARHLAYTPGWAVGCWFVPFLNLWRPVQIAQEIWRNSDPSAVADVQLTRTRNSALIGYWWAAWIVQNVIGRISALAQTGANSPEKLQSATAAAMWATVATLIAAALALAVVSAIDARQTACAEALRARIPEKWRDEE